MIPNFVFKDFWPDDSASISSGPAAYPQVPPSYCNTVGMTTTNLQLQKDPFDTSNIDNKLGQYSSQPSLMTASTSSSSQIFTSSVPVLANLTMPSYVDSTRNDAAVLLIGTNSSQYNNLENKERMLNKSLLSPTNSNKNMSVLSQSSKISIVDDNFIKELEKSLNLGKNTDSSNIPTLEPPPSAKSKNDDTKILDCDNKSVNNYKTSPVKSTSYSLTNNLAADNALKSTVYGVNDKNTNSTTSVFNKMWYDCAIRNNTGMYGTTKSCNVTESQKPRSAINSSQGMSNIVASNNFGSEFGEFLSNRPTVYGAAANGYNPNTRPNSSISLYQNDIYNKGAQNTLYGNTSSVYNNTQNGSQNITSSNVSYSTSQMQSHYNTCNSQNSLYDTYNQRLYSEVAENVYAEIPENLYSSVPNELLKPHRPAPPSPLVVVGQPLSMQQIQRKIQQGQVKGNYYTILPLFLIIVLC